MRDLKDRLIPFMFLKLATELTEAGREHIKDKNFVFPAEKKYPIHDRQHAESALGFSKMHGSPEVQARVRAAVAKKYPGLDLEKKAGLNDRPYMRDKRDVADKVLREVVLVPTGVLGGIGGALSAGEGNRIGGAAFGVAGAHGTKLLGEYLQHHASNPYLRSIGGVLPVIAPMGGSLAGYAYGNIANRLAEGSRYKEAAAPKKEKRRPWNVANIRSGKRPMSVGTMLKKEKDGTLNVKLGEALWKQAQFYGGQIPFSDVFDKGAPVVAKKNPDHIPSREDVSSQTPRREDGRDFTTTELAPGAALLSPAATNAEKTSGVLRGAGEFLEKHHAPIEVGALGYLAAPYVDNMQAKARARRAGLGDAAGHVSDEDVEKRRFIKERHHDAIEAGGLGALAMPLIAKRLTKGTWE